MYSRPHIECLTWQGSKDHWIELFEALLFEGYVLKVRVTGRSMDPVVPDGSVVHLAPLKGKSPRLGDIVFYVDCSGAPILHRVIWRGPMGYYLMGDALHTMEGPVAPEQMLGLMVKIEGSRLSRMGGLLRAMRAGLRALMGAWGRGAKPASEPCSVENQ